jgi:hypothetical protein
VNVVMNFRFPYNAENFFISWEPVSFSRRNSTPSSCNEFQIRPLTAENKMSVNMPYKFSTRSFVRLFLSCKKTHKIASKFL